MTLARLATMVIAGATYVACSSRVSPLERAPTAAGGSQGEPPAPSRDGGSTPASPTPAPDATPATPREVSRDDHYPAASAVDVTDWRRAHGTTTKVVEKTCWSLRAGVPPLPGLLCTKETLRPARVDARIYRLDDGALRLVWQAPIGSWANWLELTPLVSENGETLVVHDRRPGACRDAQAEYDAKESAGVKADFGDVLAEGCAAIGTWDWDGRRYVGPRSPP